MTSPIADHQSRRVVRWLRVQHTKPPKKSRAKPSSRSRPSAATIGNIRATLHVTGTVTAAPAPITRHRAGAGAHRRDPESRGRSRAARGDVLVRFEIPDAQRRCRHAARRSRARAGAHRERPRGADARSRSVRSRRRRPQGSRGRRPRARRRAGRPRPRRSATLGGRRDRRPPARRSAPRFDGVVAKRFHNPGDLVEAAVDRSRAPRRRSDAPRGHGVGPVADVAASRSARSAQLVSRQRRTRRSTLKVVSRPAAVEPGTATVPSVSPSRHRRRCRSARRCRSTIDAEEHRNVVLVPAGGGRSAKARRPRCSSPTATRRSGASCTLGLIDDDHVEIVSGVKAGELVIVDGQAGLPDGADRSPTGQAASRSDQ